MTKFHRKNLTDSKNSEKKNHLNYNIQFSNIQLQIWRQNITRKKYEIIQTMFELLTKCYSVLKTSVREKRNCTEWNTKKRAQWKQLHFIVASNTVAIVTAPDHSGIYPWPI